MLRANPPRGQEGHKVPVMSVAPQVLASLAASLLLLDHPSNTSAAASDDSDFGAPLGLHRVLARVRAFVKSRLGFGCVFDTSFARHLALREHVREFEERSAVGNGKELQLPMLASACPGWVCYAEKTHGQLLPFVSATKSPQQVMGTIVKRWLARRIGKRCVIGIGLSYGSKKIINQKKPPPFSPPLVYFRPDEIYHVAVMPCYDKKLEASRQDFYNEQYRTRDVDCVITTGELEVLMREHGWDLHVPVEDEDRMETYLPKAEAEASDDNSSSSVSSVSAPISFSISSASASSSSSSVGGTHVSDLELEIPELVQQPGSSSGSWLQTIIAHVQEREAARGRQTAVRSRTIRTGDYEEFSVESFVEPNHNNNHKHEHKFEFESEVVFRGAKCYGFRNLQNVVRKVGREAGVHVGAGAAGRLLTPSSGGSSGNSAGRVALRARKARQQARSAAGAEGDAEAESGSSSGRTVRGADRPYDYVEVMACPAGCVNGGGQARRVYPSFSAAPNSQLTTHTHGFTDPCRKNPITTTR